MARKLSRESIVDAALEQVHRGEPVSSAGIAEILGVRVPSLYHHIDHLEHLRTLVDDRLHDEMAVSVDPGATWPAAIRLVAWAQRAHFARHPDYILRLARLPARPDSALTTIENLVTILANAGFDLTQIRNIVGTLDLLVIGGAVVASAGKVDLYPQEVIVGQGPLESVFHSPAASPRDPAVLFQFALDQFICSLELLLLLAHRNPQPAPDGP